MCSRVCVLCVCVGSYVCSCLDVTDCSVYVYDLFPPPDAACGWVGLAANAQANGAWADCVSACESALSVCVSVATLLPPTLPLTLLQCAAEGNEVFGRHADAIK
ncbi:MAG: hypothetical protein P4L40_08625 [Terracidiphilus sp.]|nr:hypothetical protein [Terracidiphilus sp.]